MIFSGTFKTFDNEQTYSITIGKSGTSQTIVDPTENIYGPAAPTMLVMFAPDPVTINCDRQDLMKRIIISQATINLYSNQDLTDYLFADTNRDIPVTISMSGNHVFFGYVDPLQFSQGYAYNYESITISATDPIERFIQFQSLDHISLENCCSFLNIAQRYSFFSNSIPLSSAHQDQHQTRC